MNNLPAGWALTTMGEICDIVSGSTPRTADPTNWDGAIPWITPDDLSGSTRKFIERGRRSLTEKGYRSCSTRLVPAGTVLYTSRAPIGYVAIAAQPVCTNQGFKNFVPPDGVISDYVYWYLKHATPEVRSLGSGTTFLEISKQRAASIPIPIPPTAEQRRIVAAIEEQFSRIDAGVEALQRARRNLQRMRAAVLQAAVTGHLISQNPDDEPAKRFLEKLRIKPVTGPELPIGWCWVRLGDVASIGSGATPLRSRRDYYGGGTIPWVTSTMLNAEFISKPSRFITEKALRETSVRLWPAGTLLVAMYGEGQTRGKCSELLFESTTNQACAAIVLEGAASTLRPFIKLHFAANYESNRRLAVGGVQPNLSLGLIKSQLIALPPLSEQRRIIEEVDRLLSIVHALDDVLTRNHAKAGSFRRAILSCAFSGRLVPQDPSDEPASVLLDRIRSDRDGGKLLALPQRRSCR